MSNFGCLLKSFLFILCGLFLSVQSANASIDQNRAKEICGINSTNTQVVIAAVKKANAERDWDKIIGCGALAVSLEDNSADEEAVKGFLTFYNNLGEPAKIFLIDFLSTVASSASILRDSHLLGALFTNILQENFEIIDSASQKKYSDQLWLLGGRWALQDDMASFGHYVIGQAFLTGLGVDQDFDAALEQFKKSVDTYDPKASGIVNTKAAMQLSRAKYCWLAFGLARAADNQSLRRGVSECFLTINKDTADLDNIQFAVGSMYSASIFGSDKLANGFWKDIYDYLDQPNMTPAKANRYLANQCSNQSFCTVDYMYRVLAHSTAIFETSFISAALVDRVKVQASLKKSGYYQGELDGLWGNLTKKAVNSFANSNDLALFRVEELNGKLLKLFPVSDNEVNASLVKIYNKIKQKESKRVRNYNSSFTPTVIDHSDRRLKNDFGFRRQSRDPFLENANRHTNVFINGGWINCYTGGGFTTCN